MPSRLRKSGMPQLTEMPAPLSTTMFSARCSSATASSGVLYSLRRSRRRSLQEPLSVVHLYRTKNTQSGEHAAEDGQQEGVLRGMSAHLARQQDTNGGEEVDNLRRAARAARAFSASSSAPTGQALTLNGCPATCRWIHPAMPSSCRLFTRERTRSGGNCADAVIGYIRRASVEAAGHAPSSSSRSSSASRRPSCGRGQMVVS